MLCVDRAILRDEVPYAFAAGYVPCSTRAFACESTPIVLSRAKVHNGHPDRKHSEISVFFSYGAIYLLIVNSFSPIIEALIDRKSGYDYFETCQAVDFDAVQFNDHADFKIFSISHSKGGTAHGHDQSIHHRWQRDKGRFS